MLFTGGWFKRTSWAVAALMFATVAVPVRAQSLNPAVTAETLAETVCVAGYTKTVRPGSAWLRRLKLRLLEAIGEPPETAHRYQLDHAMPLVLGGASRDPANYHLQPWGEATHKDRLERKLGCLVCMGQVPLDEAQRAISGDWRAAYGTYARVKCRRPWRR